MHEHFQNIIQSATENSEIILHQKTYADWIEENPKDDHEFRHELLRMAARIREFPSEAVHHYAGYNPEPYWKPIFENYSETHDWARLSKLPMPTFKLGTNEDYWVWYNWSDPYPRKESQRPTDRPRCIG